jgi:hypothetical protein
VDVGRGQLHAVRSGPPPYQERHRARHRRSSRDLR